MSVREQARQVIELLKPQLQEQGYTVYLEPSRQFLPSFMEQHVPDAIALGPTGRKNLAIEVLIDGDAASDTLQSLKERMRDTSDWELRVIYARPDQDIDVTLATSRGSIERSLETVRALIAEQRFAPALLMAWATFEGLCRLLLPLRFSRPQTPARLVDVMAGDGYLTPSEADLLRRLALQRNEFSHGGLDQIVEAADVEAFFRVLVLLASLADEHPETASPAS